MSSALRYADDAAVFEVATLSADTLRARVRVTGALTGETAPLLTSAVGTHLCAGRRHLRLDLSMVTEVDDQGLDALSALHRAALAGGGLLVLDGALADSRLGRHVADLRRSA